MEDFWNKLLDWLWTLMPYIITAVLLGIFPLAKWVIGWEISWGWIAGISVVFMIVVWIVIMIIMMSKGHH